jgi:hypothetical protein
MQFCRLAENWWTLMTYWKSLNTFCADHVCPSGYVSPNIRARTIGQGFFFVAKFDLGIVVRLDFLPPSSTMNVLILKP